MDSGLVGADLLWELAGEEVADDCLAAHLLVDADVGGDCLEHIERVGSTAVDRAMASTMACR